MSKMAVGEHGCPFRNCAMVGTAVAIGVALWYVWKKGGCCGKKSCCKGVNPGVEKSNPKVVHNVDIEDIGEKAAFCRCWRSSKFPYCDGTHTKFNEECGENVGPLVISGKKK